MTERIVSLAIAALLLGGVACSAKRPVLYPNRTLVQNGREQADADIDTCVESAQTYGAGTNAAGRTAASTAKGAAVGAAAGGTYGAIVHGDGGRRAAGGAAAGASAGLLRGLFRWRDPDPIERRFVNICLSQDGYQVIGWR